MNLCSRPSRIFSGDPLALFGPDLQINVQQFPLGVDGTLFDFQPVPSNQFEYITHLSMFAQLSAGSTSASSAFLMLIMPNTAVSPITPTAANLGTSLGGVRIRSGLQTLTSTVTNANADGGFAVDPPYYPFVVPPKYFLRFVKLANGDTISAGSYMVITKMSVLVSVDFSKLG